MNSLGTIGYVSKVKTFTDDPGKHFLSRSTNRSWIQSRRERTSTRLSMDDTDNAGSIHYRGRR